MEDGGEIFTLENPFEMKYAEFSSFFIGVDAEILFSYLKSYFLGFGIIRKIYENDLV